MSATEIVNGISETCDRIEIQRHEIGYQCWGIKLWCNDGPDFIVPGTYDNLQEVNTVIKNMRLAMKLGGKMASRRIRNFADNKS